MPHNIKSAIRDLDMELTAAEQNGVLDMLISELGKDAVAAFRATVERLAEKEDVYAYWPKWV